MALAISVATFNLPKAGPKQITGDTFSICSGGGKGGYKSQQARNRAFKTVFPKHLKKYGFVLFGMD